ncbi:hypothetical protein E3N88_41468 [Mikania micrantha]|uniref:AAA+ ATPase domain-containing protein n=1 Tax=Mikania micrantha TaxID=192012 RepID=A0A5N6LRG4_9ASTR|nr:hypothetical protein E3N88_41468 [Mikania micrantha]
MRRPNWILQFDRLGFRIFQEIDLDLQSSDSATSVQDDFVTRVLKENPSQVEPKYKVGDKLYTLKEKENLGKKGYDGNGALEIIKRLNLKGLKDNRSRDGVDYSQDVHLNDILRKFKGKLYVPEQIFVEELSEEAEFDREFELLPRMSFDDLQKTVRTNMIKFMTFKDDDKVAYVHKDLIVELKEILLVKLDGTQVQEVLKEYNGPRYEIETQTMGSTGVTFDDVAGIEIAVEEFQELVKYLKNPELFDKMGIKPPHGVLLEGPPGCGKVNKQSVIFIDEIDALATRRQGIFSDKTDDLYNAATQERETTLNQPLIELDGFDTGKGVIFLGATNRKDLLDPALLRPGRFDRKIRIRPPNAKGRLEILQVHARKVKLSESVDLSVFAQNLSGTSFFNSYSHIQSGAKLAQLLQEAALVAVRNKHKSILQSDVGEAVDRLTVGPKRVALDLGHQGQCRRATTEVGTALTSHLIRRTENADVEPCDRISIHPRGQTLSQVVFNRLDDEKYIFERRPRATVLLGGRAAEEVIFGRDTSKASVNYLADATWLARKIITIWNMENPMVIDGEPPPWRRQPKFVGPRLDFEESLYDDYDLIEPPINFNMDDEIAKRTENLISNMYGKTVSLLRRHHTALLKTIKVLLRQMEMTGDEIDYILDKYPPNTPTSRLLEEGDPGSLEFFKQTQGQDLELDQAFIFISPASRPSCSTHLMKRANNNKRSCHLTYAKVESLNSRDEGRFAYAFGA